MSACIRHKVILQAKPQTDGLPGIAFVVSEPETVSEQIESYRMPADLWDEMGCPDVITLTVDLGDTLND